MNQYKIIFTGPVGAGKTTAINAVSDITTIKTDVAATDWVKLKKPATTVAMDYGMMNWADDIKFHLYGTPGQDRFDFMWDLLTAGGDGLVLLLNNASPEPLQDMTDFLKAFGKFIQNTRMTIGITQMDKCAEPGLEVYRQHIKNLGFEANIWIVDARVKQDVGQLLEDLLSFLNPAAVKHHSKELPCH